MAKAEYMTQGFLFFSLHIKSFFDREIMDGCIQAMKEVDVNNKAIRIWSKMNCDTTVRVKTPIGMSNERFVGDCVAQGTISAAMVSAINLDRSIVKAFECCNKIFKFGNVKFIPLTYQDDIGDIIDNLQMLNDHAHRIDLMFKRMKLQAHKDKSGVIILGRRKFREIMKNDLMNNPIEFYGFLKLKVYWNVNT